MSSDEGAPASDAPATDALASDKDQQAPDEVCGEKGKKKRTWSRGKHMTPSKRAKQFPGVFDVRGDSLWCLACCCAVACKEKSTASKHVKSNVHIANVAKKDTRVEEPGASCPLTPEPVVASSMFLFFAYPSTSSSRPSKLEASGFTNTT